MNRAFPQSRTLRPLALMLEVVAYRNLGVPGLHLQIKLPHGQHTSNEWWQNQNVQHCSVTKVKGAGRGWMVHSQFFGVSNLCVNCFSLNVYLQYFAIICIVSAWRTQGVRDVWRFLHMRANDRRRAGSQRIMTPIFHTAQKYYSCLIACNRVRAPPSSVCVHIRRRLFLRAWRFMIAQGYSCSVVGWM